MEHKAASGMQCGGRPRNIPKDAACVGLLMLRVARKAGRSCLVIFRI